MPDALSKTIPIWCAVINRFLFPDLKEAHKLCTPPRCVSGSEHDQIEELLPKFVESFFSLQLENVIQRQKITKPLQPFWVVQDSPLPTVQPDHSDKTAIILCTSSRRVTEGDVAADGYIQGAGDDNEHWSLGLTPDVFWKHRESIMSTSEEELPKVIEQFMAEQKTEGTSNTVAPVLVSSTASIFVGPDSFLQQGGSEIFPVVIHCGNQPSEVIREHLKGHYWHLKCRAGRTGSKDLRRELRKLSAFFTSDQHSEKVFVCCTTGTDLAIGVALYIICRLDAARSGVASDPNSSDLLASPSETLDKDFIRKRLAWISAAQPILKPSRATLLAVNDALLSDGNRAF